jgi:hypothetical protein
MYSFSPVFEVAALVRNWGDILSKPQASQELKLLANTLSPLNWSEILVML